MQSVDTSASAVERFLLAPDFEWNKTAAVARIQVQLGGLTVAIHEAAYTPPPPGSCSGVAPGFSLEDGGSGPELLLPLAANLLATWLAWCVLWLLWRRPRGTRARAAFALGLGVAVFVFTSVPSPLSPLASRPAYARFPGTVVYRGERRQRRLLDVASERCLAATARPLAEFLVHGPR